MKLGRFFILCLVLVYIGVYIWLRMSGDIVRHPGKSPDISARSSGAVQKAAPVEDPDIPTSKGSANISETKVIVLDATFWPLRKLELAYWKYKG